MAAEGIAEVFAVFERFGNGFDGCNLSTALSRVAKLAAEGRDLDGRLDMLQGLLAAVAARLHEFAPRHACNVLWSLGKLGIRDVRLLEAIASFITTHFRELSPRDLGVASWGFASNRYRHTPSLSAIGAMAIEQKDLLEPPELSNVVWGFATLHFRQGQVMAKLAVTCTAGADMYQPKELASVLWAYSSLSYRDDHETRTDSPLFTKIGGLLAARAADFDPQGITNLVWSYANIHHHAPEQLLHGCAMRLAKLWAALKPQEIANSVWAFERLGSAGLADATSAWVESSASSDGPKSNPEGWSGEPFLLQDWSGEQLLKLAGYLEVYQPCSRACDLVSKTFEKRFFGPVRDFLLDLPPDTNATSYAKALRSFELFHLGPHYTPKLLDALGASLGHSQEEDTFRAEAKAALLCYYLEGEAPPALQERAMLTGGQTTSRWIAAEMQYELFSAAAADGEARRSSGRCVVPAATVQRPGRVLADFGSMREDDAHGQRADRASAPSDAADDQVAGAVTASWLWSVKLAGDVGRGSHCECVALGEVLARELRAHGFAGLDAKASAPALRDDAAAGGATRLTGKVRLFTTHYPCLSCLGLIAQFRRRLPSVRLAVDYVEWRDWQREMRRELARGGTKRVASVE